MVFVRKHMYAFVYVCKRGTVGGGGWTEIGRVCSAIYKHVVDFAFGLAHFLSVLLNLLHPCCVFISAWCLFVAGIAVITGLGYPSRVAIQMLQELYKEFHAKYGSEAESASKDAFTKKAKNLLKDTCTKYDDLKKVDKTSGILSKVDEAKSSMQSNIANMLKNTEAAESLAEKSDQLNEQASVFKKRSTDLRKQMAWKDLKMTLLLGGIVVVILIVIIVPVVKAAKKN
jgi:Synaptobrevin